MLKKLLLVSVLLSFSLSFSQEMVSSIPINFKKNTAIFQTVNNTSKEVTLFITDKVNVKAVKLNEKMQIIDSISVPRPNTKLYGNMIGYNNNESNPCLFWSSSYEEVFTQVYDFKTRQITTKQHTLVLENEKVLKKFSENDNFYILTVLKNSNNLKFHIFDKEGNYRQKIISLDGFHFFKTKYEKSDLYGVLGQNLLPYEAPFSLQYINTENPVSLTESAKRRKCYFNKKQLTITIDVNVNFTQVIIIDLDKFSAVEKIINTPSISNMSPGGYPLSLSSNSFLLNNKLYQTKSSSELFYFVINDLDGNVLKQYEANADSAIEFKNTEISQEGGDFGGGKRLLDASQFIRKINNLHSGISCYNLGANTLITFGGVSAPQQSTASVIGGQFGAIGSLLATFVFNPTVESFNSYSDRKVVKIEGLFDSEGKHIKGDLQPLAFDKIRTFFEKEEDFSSQTLFKMDAYYLGYYNNKSKEYIIRKFID